MSITTVAIIGLFAVLLPVIFSFISTSLKSMANGVEFVISIFTTVPDFLFNEFIPNLPPFFQTAFYGLLGFMLFVLATKIILSIK